jgi:hypothetical protein
MKLQGKKLASKYKTYCQYFNKEYLYACVYPVHIYSKSEDPHAGFLRANRTAHQRKLSFLPRECSILWRPRMSTWPSVLRRRHGASMGTAPYVRSTLAPDLPSTSGSGCRNTKPNRVPAGPARSCEYIELCRRTQFRWLEQAIAKSPIHGRYRKWSSDIGTMTCEHPVVPPV